MHMVRESYHDGRTQERVNRDEARAYEQYTKNLRDSARLSKRAGALKHSVHQAKKAFTAIQLSLCCDSFQSPWDRVL